MPFANWQSVNLWSYDIIIEDYILYSKGRNIFGELKWGGIELSFTDDTNDVKNITNDVKKRR